MALSSKREDVYRVVKAFATRGEWVNAEAKHYTQALVRSKTLFVFLVCNKENAGCWFSPNQWQMRDFERNGLNLTLTKREEMQRVRVQIDELSLRYIRNLHEDSTFLVFTATELAGLPQEFLKV